MPIAMLALVALAGSGCALIGEPTFRRLVPETSVPTMDASVAEDAEPEDVVEPPEDAEQMDADVRDDAMTVDNPTVADVPSDVPVPCGAGTTRCNDLCVNLQNNVEHCGACGRACPSPQHTLAVCRLGTCLQPCEPGYGDCNNNPGDGCELRLNASAACGRCGNSCVPPMGMCAGAIGMESCQSSCAANQIICGGACVSTQSDPNNCGGCGQGCAVGNRQQASCVNGVCNIQCVDGYADCNGRPADGCEIQVSTDASNCGRCENHCNGPNQFGTCSNGVCTRTCAFGFADCDRNVDNGCETEIARDVNNCGRCAVVCPDPLPGIPACVDGMCRACGSLSTFCPHPRRNPANALCCAGLGADCDSLIAICVPPR
jgi:hypothetical protein